jgi:hypothetical protein
MDDLKCGHVRLYSHCWRGATEHTPCMICERDELRSKLDHLRGALENLRDHKDDTGADYETYAREFCKGTLQILSETAVENQTPIASGTLTMHREWPKTSE